MMGLMLQQMENGLAVVFGLI